MKAFKNDFIQRGDVIQFTSPTGQILTATITQLLFNSVIARDTTEGRDWRFSTTFAINRKISDA